MGVIRRAGKIQFSNFIKIHATCTHGQAGDDTGAAVELVYSLVWNPGFLTGFLNVLPVSFSVVRNSSFQILPRNKLQHQVKT